MRGRFVVPRVNPELTRGPAPSTVLGHSGQHGGFMATGVMAERHVGRRHLREASTETSFPAIAGIGVNSSGTVTAWNAGAERLLGWPSADVIGRRLPAIRADLWPDFEALLHAARQDVGLSEGDLRWRR